MRFKIDENLKRVAAVMAVRPETVAVELCDRFIDAGMIEVDPKNWGESVLRAAGKQYVSDVCAVLADYLYNDETHSVPADVFDAFCSITVMGDGDCPHCGGELRFINNVYKCRDCGETIKYKNEL